MGKETTKGAKTPPKAAEGRGSAGARKPPEGRRFQPGQSGNPGGGKKIPEDVKQAFRSLTMDAVKTLTSIMQSGDSDTSRLRAAEIILNRAWGTPTQAVDLTGGEGLPLEVIVRYVG